MSEIRGHVASGFEPVRDVFAETFEAGEELGAGFAAILEGETVVDIQGGYADRKKEKVWDEQTLVPIYSTTKGIAALVIASVIGALDDGEQEGSGQSGARTRYSGPAGQRCRLRASRPGL